MSLEDMPIGAIIAWKSASIPDNWAVCNGAGGTPDIIGRLIMGASINSDLQTIAGAESHSHVNPNTSSRSNHGHTLSVSVASASTSVKATVGTGTTSLASGSHGHSGASLSVTSADAHSHTVGNTDTKDHRPPRIKRIFIKKVS